MAYYRLYHIKSGHFFRYDMIEAEGDIDAVGEAGALIGEHPAELWCADRKVMMFDGREAENGDRPDGPAD